MNTEIELIQKSSGGMLCVVCPKKKECSLLCSYMDLSQWEELSLIQRGPRSICVYAIVDSAVNTGVERMRFDRWHSKRL